MNSRLPKVFFALMVVCAVIYFSRLYPQLPAVVASHFDAHGTPNGWQTKQAFFGVFAGVTFIAAFFVFLVPPLIAIVPPQYVNLPNKNYWLAPERIADAHRFLSGWFAWFGCAVFGVIVVGCDDAVKWNLGVAEKPGFTHLWFVLAAFGVFTAVWSIRMMLRFGRIPERTETLKRKMKIAGS
jgi:uncharacterized membrane protein